MGVSLPPPSLLSGSLRPRRALRGPCSEPPPPIAPGGRGDPRVGTGTERARHRGAAAGAAAPRDGAVPSALGCSGYKGPTFGEKLLGFRKLAARSLGELGPAPPAVNTGGGKRAGSGCGTGEGGAQSLLLLGLGGSRMVLCQVRQGQPRWVRLPACQPNPPVLSLIPRCARMDPQAVSVQPFPRVPGASLQGTFGGCLGTPRHPSPLFLAPRGVSAPRACVYL